MTEGLKHPYRLLRLLGALEGMSFLVLLGVAVPMKYLMDLPIAVRVVGPVHGALFIAYMGALYRGLDYGLPLGRAALGFVASLLPFGWLGFDRVLKRALDAEAAPATDPNAPAGGAAE